MDIYSNFQKYSDGKIFSTVSQNLKNYFFTVKKFRNELMMESVRKLRFLSHCMKNILILKLPIIYSFTVLNNSKYGKQYLPIREVSA